MELVRGSILHPYNLLTFFSAWAYYVKVELKLSVYESYISLRRFFGMKPIAIA